MPFADSLRELVARAATSLPGDVRRALFAAAAREDAASPAGLALRVIGESVGRAEARGCAPCPDGRAFFEVRAPLGFDSLGLSAAIADTVAALTAEGRLRCPAVDALTPRGGRGDACAVAPAVRFEPWRADDVEVRVLFRGGGCENVSAQYTLPCWLPELRRAERDLDGVRKCALHAVHEAQGRGCPAGILGVVAGGDRATGYQHANRQLLRPLDDRHADPELARLEEDIVEQANRLGIGVMGLGGRVSLLGCKVDVLDHFSAACFVTVAYNGWALRRQGAVLDASTGAIRRWLFPEEPGDDGKTAHAIAAGGRPLRLTTPLGEAEVRQLRVGDLVHLSGPVHTGRAFLHRHLAQHDSPVDLRGAVLYQCEAAAAETGGAWSLRAAGPATSHGLEAHAPELIRRSGLRALLGKGGVGRPTQAALREQGAVYLSAVGGAAQYYADCIDEVLGVDFLEWGPTEAMWHLRVRDLPAIVTIDSRGTSLHQEVEQLSAHALARLAVCQGGPPPGPSPAPPRQRERRPDGLERSN